MRRWEKIMVVSVAVLAVVGIAVGVLTQRWMPTFWINKQSYENVVGTPEPGTSEEIFDENGQLTEEAEKKLEEKLQEGESDVVLQVKDVGSPRSIPKIKLAEWKPSFDKKSKKETIQFFNDLVKDNAAKKSYQVQYNKDATKDNPYGLTVHSSDIYVSKRYYDMNDVVPWKLTEETAQEKGREMVAAVNQFYDVSLDEKAIEWDIREWTVEDKACPVYENGEKEDVYEINVRQGVQGRPVFADYSADEQPVSAQFVLSGTGWRTIDVSGEKLYQVAQGEYKDLVSVEEAVRTVKEMLEMTKDIWGTRVYTITDAELGYWQSAGGKIRPVWRFYGDVEDKMQFVPDGEMIIDAQSGKIIKNRIGE